MTTILAAIDLSDVTERVIDTALEWTRDGRIVLLHVARPDPDYVTYRVGPEDERDAIADHLREVRARLHAEVKRLEAGGRAADALVVQGDPATRIAEEARRRRVDLIVVGRHHHGHLHDRLVGSVAGAILRDATCPVLVVPTARAKLSGVEPPPVS